METNETVNLTQAKRPKSALKSVSELTSALTGMGTKVATTLATDAPEAVSGLTKLVVHGTVILVSSLRIAAIEAEIDALEEEAMLFSWSKEEKDQQLKAIKIKYAR